MGHLAWGALALLGGVGGLVSTGHANTEVAAIMTVAALGALVAAFIWHLRQPERRGSQGLLGLNGNDAQLGDQLSAISGLPSSPGWPSRTFEL
jgi:hypothetical protein